MVIAHVIDSLEVGGAEAVVAALCRIQVDAGHSVEVHCLMNGGPIADNLEARGIRVFVHGPAHTLAVVRRLFRSFRRSRPDIVHCHNKAATVRAAAVARATGVGVVITTRHGMAAPPYRLRKELKFWTTAALFCDRVVAVCDKARANMIVGAGVFARNVVTIRNGAYPPSFGDTAVPKRGFTLISVGRLARAKDFGTLLRAFAIARRRVPDLVLWILGDGDEAARLKQLSNELEIAAAVRFWGEHSDVGTWLRAADLFVLSSISEGLPISALEAMATGLPTILTDVGGMPELVALSGSGKIVPVADPAALADAFVEFASRRDELETLRERSSRCYQEYFTPERMTNEYLALYRACAGSAKTAI